MRVLALAVLFACSMAGAQPVVDPAPARLEALRIALNDLGKKLEAADPAYARKLPFFVGQVRPMNAALARIPVTNATEIVERLYWSLPDPAHQPSVALPSGVRAMVEPRRWVSRTCQAVSDARAALASASSEVEDCASRIDSYDDCSAEIQEAREAGEDLETAANEAGDDCLE